MGLLKRHDIRLMKRMFDIDLLIETGTYKGESVAHALRCGYQKIITIEIIESLAKQAQEQFADFSGVLVVNAESAPGINSLFLSGKIDQKEKILWWLDAHLPQHYSNDYDQLTDKNIIFPLKGELTAITKNRDVSRDIFIMDDLRLYEDGPFLNGNCSKGTRPFSNHNFVIELLGATHKITKDFRDEGYLVALPISRQ